MLNLDDIYRKCLINPTVQSSLYECLTLEEINEVEKYLGEKFPSHFCNFLLKYPISIFSIGTVSFGYDENYSEFLILRNTINEYMPSWWGLVEKPKNLVLIGSTDSRLIFVDMGNDKIYACDRNEGFSGRYLIASNIEEFIINAGNVFFVRNFEFLIPSTTIENKNDNLIWYEISGYDPKLAPIMNIEQIL